MPTRGSPPATTTFTIHEFCSEFGVPATTVWYYVKRGLLPPPVGGRGPAARYTSVHWQRMKAIRAARAGTLSLGEVKERLG